MLNFISFLVLQLDCGVKSVPGSMVDGCCNEKKVGDLIFDTLKKHDYTQLSRSWLFIVPVRAVRVSV